MAGVDARHLHCHQPEEQRASASAPVTLHADAAQVQLLERGKQLERESVVGPVLRGDRRDLAFHERADLLHDRQLLGRQGLRELIEVTVGRRQRLSLGSSFRLSQRGHLSDSFSGELSLSAAIQVRT